MSNIAANYLYTHAHTYRAVSMNIPLIEKVLRGKTIIPEFQSFKDEVDSIYSQCVDNREGEVGPTLSQRQCVVYSLYFNVIHAINCPLMW